MQIHFTKILASATGLFISLTAWTQITITNANFPSAGDRFEQINDTLPTISQGNAGANQTYDLSALQNHRNSFVSFDAASSSPNGSNYPQAELVTPFFGAEGFLDVTTTNVDVIGFSGDPTGSGFNVNATFDNPQTITKAPTTYNTTWTDAAHFVAGLPGSVLAGAGLPIQVDSVRITYDANTTSNADGYGTVTTPDGSWPCIRNYRVVRTDLKIELGTPTFIGLVWIDLESQLGGSLPPELIDQLHDTTYTYDYMTTSLKLPRAQVDVDINGTPIRANYAHVDFTGISNPTAISKIVVFPNPAQSLLHVLTPEFKNYTYEIISMQGIVVARGEINAVNQFDISVDNMPKGVYQLKLIDKNLIVGQSKFVKQ